LFRKKNCPASIFLDLDGPILDVSKRHYLVYKDIVDRLGGRPLNKRTYWALKRSKVGLSLILKLSGIKSQVRFKSQWLKLIEARPYLVYDRVWPPVKKLLAGLRERHKLVLVTLRSSPANLNWQLTRLGLKKYFPIVLRRGDNQSDWRTKYRLIKESGKVSLPAWIIGDTEIDILAGQKLKMHTVAVTSGIRNELFLRKLRPDYMFSSLKEITKIIK
jgi:phosphoglycolate phosphatase